MFLEFLVQHWWLAAAWCVVTILLFVHEARKGGKSVGPQGLTHMLNREGGLVLDVRDNKDFNQGHITDAYHIPLKDLEKRLSEIDSHKEKPVIVVCKMGQSAGGATKIMKAKGFQQVYKLAGGMTEWQGVGLPLVKK